MTGILSSARLALETLRVNPLRTALSTLGIIMGAGSLAAVLSLADGSERLAREAIEREGLSTVQVRPETEQLIDGVRVPVEGFPVFDEADAHALAASLGPSTGVELSIEGTGRIGAPFANTRAARIVGRYALSDRTPPASADDLAEGRLLNAHDMSSGAAVSVISANLAEALANTAGGAGPVGSWVTIGATSFQVVGIRKPLPNERIFTVTVPLARAEGAMVATPAVRPRVLTLTAADVDRVPAVRSAAEAFGRARAAWNGRFSVASYGRERLEQASRAFLVFKMLMGAFTAISLVVGGIGIMNVLLASILERTREIGIRKAVGARRRDVLRQFLVESMTISLAGTAAGVALGLSASFIFTAIIRAKTQAPMHAAATWQTFAVTAAAAVTIGVLAGLYPALRASKLTTIDAIQRE